MPLLPTSQYRVTDLRQDRRLAALRDTLGRSHVVHMAAALPEVGVVLTGPPLRRGARVLLSDRTGQVYEADIDATECAEQYVLERLHAAACTGARPAR